MFTSETFCYKLYSQLFDKIESMCWSPETLLLRQSVYSTQFLHCNYLSNTHCNHTTLITNGNYRASGDSITKWDRIKMFEQSYWRRALWLPVVGHHIARVPKV